MTETDDETCTICSFLDKRTMHVRVDPVGVFTIGFVAGVNLAAKAAAPPLCPQHQKQLFDGALEFGVVLQPVGSQAEFEKLVEEHGGHTWDLESDGEEKSS